MRGQQTVRLSEVATEKPESDKLTATNKSISKLDYVPWDTSDIKYVNLQFNSVEFLTGLGQFQGLVGLDLSNNNICALSDLRLLSRHEHLEYVDLTNNPIVHHDFYREFVTIFVKNLKVLDRIPIDKKQIEEVRKESGFVKDVLITLLINFLKIVAAKNISARLTLNAELLGRNTEPDELEIKRAKMFEILQDNIIEGFEDNTLIEFEAYILDDLEMLMDRLYGDKLFVEAWGLACAEFGTQQIEKLQKYLSALQLDEKTIKRLAFRNQDDEGSKSSYSLPVPERRDHAYSPNYSPAKSRATSIRQPTSRSRSNGKSKQEAELLASLNDKSCHLRNCLGLTVQSCNCNKQSRGVSPGQTPAIIQKINIMQKRVAELESLVKHKLAEISSLEREGRELGEKESEIQELVIAMESRLEPKRLLEDEAIQLKREIVLLQEKERHMHSLRNRLAQLEAEKRMLQEKVVKLKSRLAVLEGDYLDDIKKNEQPLANHLSIIRKAFKGWREFSLQRAKLVLLLQMKSEKRKTQVFCSWKRHFAEYKKQNLGVLLQVRQLKQTRLREESIREQEQSRKEKDLAQLMEKLENPQPRVVPQTKIARKRELQKADHHYQATRQNFLKVVFLEWKASNAPFRESKAVLKKKEKVQCWRKVFSALKEFSGNIERRKEVAASRRALAVLKLKRGLFRSWRRFSDKEALRKLQLEEIGNRVVKTAWEVWREAFSERKTMNSRIAFIRRRTQKIKKESVFSQWKELIERHKVFSSAFSKVFRARDRIHARRKLQLFQQNTECCANLAVTAKRSRAANLTKVFQALKASTMRTKNLSKVSSNLSSVESNWVQNSWRIFFEIFKVNSLRILNKERALNDLLKRRRLRAQGFCFDALLTEVYRSQKQKRQRFEAEKSQVKMMAEQQRNDLETALENHQESLEQRRGLQVKISQEEELIVARSGDASVVSGEIDRVRTSLEETRKQGYEDEIAFTEAEAKLKAQLELEVERESDYSQSIRVATQDVEMLEQCLRTRKSVLFQVEERLKKLQLEQRLLKEKEERQKATLQSERDQIEANLIELKTKTESMNDRLNGLERELQSATANIQDSEADTECIQKMKEQAEVTSQRTNIKVGQRQLIEINENKRDRNSEIETMGRLGLLHKVAPGTNLNDKSNSNEIHESSAVQITQERNANRNSVPLALSSHNYQNSQVRASPALSDRLSPNLKSDYEDRSTREFILNASHFTSGGGNDSFNQFHPPHEPLASNDDTETMLMGMQEDLKYMRMKRENMVSDLRDKIRCIEDELNNTKNL